MNTTTKNGQFLITLYIGTFTIVLLSLFNGFVVLALGLSAAIYSLRQLNIAKVTLSTLFKQFNLYILLASVYLIINGFEKCLVAANI